MYDALLLAYEEHAPGVALAAHVKCFWTLRGSTDGAPAERILPDGSFELIFHLGDPFMQSGSPQPKGMLMGDITRAVLVTPGRHANVLGIRFRPGGAGALFPMPMRELRGHVLPIDEVFAGLTARVFESGDPVATMRDVLRQRVRRPDLLALRAVDLIARRSGDIRVRELASALGSTERTLERSFDTAVGVGPKMYSRIARVQATLRGEDAGYYDDAHRIHEFREIAGVTPSEFLRERNAVNDAIVGNLQGDGDPAR